MTVREERTAFERFLWGAWVVSLVVLLWLHCI